MALKIVRGKNLPIGIDIGSTSIKAAQLRQVDGGFELLAAGAQEIPAAFRSGRDKRMSVLPEMIRDVIHSDDFHGSQCILSLPAEDTFVQHVKLPRVKTDDLSRIVQAELRGKLPYSVEEAEVRHLVVADVPGEPEPKQEVIAIAAPSEVLKAYLAMSRRAKLDVVGINIEPCAIVECFARLFRRSSDGERTLLFIDLGAESTQVVFAHGSRIVFARNLQTGGSMLDRAVAEGLQMSVEEAHALRINLLQGQAGESVEEEVYRRLLDPVLDTLGGELSKCLRYHESIFRSRTIERAIFVGGQAYDKRLCQSLAERLNVPAQVGDPLLRIGRSTDSDTDDQADRREPQPDWAVAVGLSAGAAA